MHEAGVPILAEINGEIYGAVPSSPLWAVLDRGVTTGAARR
jgi:hypothetical protein